jgi:hypothetical protein
LRYLTLRLLLPEPMYDFDLTDIEQYLTDEDAHTLYAVVRSIREKITRAKRGDGWEVEELPVFVTTESARALLGYLGPDWHPDGIVKQLRTGIQWALKAQEFEDAERERREADELRRRVVAPEDTIRGRRGMADADAEEDEDAWGDARDARQ